ncbi:MAG: carboxylating nicotinate-nucleotide diphosphorylase [Armatimonadetes bacterium]|nr:carboxylating nicotinate-nucleotide diphosphorylase [Armatimonadota bacterium]
MNLIFQVESILKKALEEDLPSGDITTNLLINPDSQARGHILAKEEGVLAGIEIAKLAFETLDSKIDFKILKKDGEKIIPQDILADLKGSAQNILMGERTALNFLQRLSGIASFTKEIVKLTKNSKTRILDTRKTTPGLRLLEKYAVRVGGGLNHRYSLGDGILIKNNHLKFSSIKESINKLKNNAYGKKIEIEIENIAQLKEALKESPDIIMLDNMSLSEIKASLEIINGMAQVEVSGRVNLNDIPKLCKMGVDYISIGALTHSVKSLDLSLKIIKTS